MDFFTYLHIITVFSRKSARNFDTGHAGSSYWACSKKIWEAITNKILSLTLYEQCDQLEIIQ
jgi:hypothetical protein